MYIHGSFIEHEIGKNIHSLYREYEYSSDRNRCLRKITEPCKELNHLGCNKIMVTGYFFCLRKKRFLSRGRSMCYGKNGCTDGGMHGIIDGRKIEYQYRN